MAATLLQELKSWVGWGEADETALRSLHRHAEPHFQAISDTFYAAILANPSARSAITGGDEQVGRLNATHRGWLDALLRGPWDEAWFEARSRIGRVHVQIDLAQHHMFGAMNLVRRELDAVVERSPLALAERKAARLALGRILDLELAVMLHTYREDSLSRQARAERLATFGQLAGSIGHDLRNPLAVIEGSLHLLRKRGAVKEAGRPYLDRIGQQVAVANDIIQHLLDLIRDRPLVRERVELEALLSDAASTLPRPAGVAFVSALDPGLWAEGDPVALRQVVVNLLTNAVEASSPRGEVKVRGRAEEGVVLLAFEDTGPGVAPAVAARLFEPLVTTKAHGVGLGLALVKRIVERHGGAIGYQPRPGGGARFTVRLPSPARPP